MRREDGFDDLLVLHAACLLETRKRLRTASDGPVVSPVEISQGGKSGFGAIFRSMLQCGVANFGRYYDLGWIRGGELCTQQ